MRISLCGAIAVEWEGESLASRLPGRQGRLLFAYLVLHRERPVSRDELAEAIEGAQLAPPLSRLRRALGEGRLEGRDRLRLVLPDDVWIDWEAAREGVARAAALAAAGAWRDAWGPASAARAIAERRLLPGLEAGWIEPLRSELEEVRVEALELLARTGLALGGAELAPATRAARAVVEAAPFRESAYAVLMDALRAEGNVAEALLVYERLRTLLRDELGTAPSAEVVARHEELLRGGAPAASPGTAPSPGPRATPSPGPRATPSPGPGATPSPGPGAVPSPGPRAAPSPGPRATPSPGPRATPLLERDREVAALRAPLDRLLAGDGGVLVLEGPAGVGKTRLLGVLRRDAASRGARVLTARAGELERGFAFGVVRQLLEAEVDDALLAGAAAPAAAVFGDAAEGSDISFAALHGLFWLAVGLAERAPLVLAVDDVQWCDPASLRWLVYLARRLEGVPVLVAATLRTGDPAADAVLLDELLHDPATRSVRPGPLSVDAVAALAAAGLGADPDPDFAAACHEATAGNPLLVERLLGALADDGVAPAAGSVPAVAAVGARAVSRSILSRLARLPAGAAEVARAVAVLGEGARLPAAATLAGVEEAQAAEAVSALVRADLLRPDALGFVHPLVRDAVLGAMSAVERDARHAEAARVLAEAAAPDEAVALHLLRAPPRGDEWAARTLRDAGRAALRRGALESALAHLRRALDEPPPPGERAGLLLELGEVERESDAPAAVGHLRDAYAALTEPADRAAAAQSLVWTLCFLGPPEEAVAVAQEALAELPPALEDARHGIEALGLFTGFWHGVRHEHERWAQLRADPPRGDGPGAKMLLAATAWQWAISDGHRDRCVPLAREALAGGTLLAHDPSLMAVAAATVLGMADEDDALAPWDRLRSDAHRHGSAMVTTPVHMWRGWVLGRRGELEEAVLGLREAMAQQVLWGLGPEVRAYTVGLAAEALLEAGDVAGVRALVDGAAEPPPGSDLRTFLLTGRAQLALAEGDPAGAVAATDELAAAPSAIENPAWVPWRSARALGLHGIGRAEEAVAVAWEDLGFAKRWGSPGAIGRALRVLGTVEGEHGREHLREAVVTLTGTPARLELARARAALGERPGETGLTDLERRAAALAVEGMDARGVAQALFLTPKAASDLLGAVRRKLSASSVEELRAALAEGRAARANLTGRA